MRILRGAPVTWNAGTPTALAVGVFDGVHIGHRHVLRLLVEAAENDGLKPAVLTFDPHPLALVKPEWAPRMLTTIDQRIAQLASAGVELVAVMTFDDSIRHMAAESFVSDILADSLCAKFVVAGQDFRYGEDRQGDVALLAQMGEQLGFRSMTSPLIGGTDPISSTRIRQALGEGDVTAAAAMLGRNYVLVGGVVPGAGRRGETVFATANVFVDPALSIPAHGVYAVRAGVDEMVPAVANLGVRPTFGDGAETVEVHVIDRQLDIVGDRIRIEFVARLRDERVFAGMAELADQIRLDIESARLLLR
jgi:riboflavin kinase / FMN adenylyltransferase